MRAEPQYESNFQRLARIGFLARGLLYILIAWLVIATGRTEDLTGAMEYVGDGAGRGLLLLMIAGMSGYGLWRVSDAVFGMEGGHRSKDWSRRIGAGVSGIIYLFLAYKALRLAMGGPDDTGDAHRHAANALDLPAGAFLLFAAAAVLGGAGALQMYKAATCSFLEQLDDRARQPLVKWLGRIGYGARGVIFVTVGYLLARAALDQSAARVGGLEQALDALRGPLLLPVAAGLMLFGLFSLVEARFRRIHNPPPADEIKQDIADKLRT